MTSRNAVAPADEPDRELNDARDGAEARALAAEERFHRVVESITDYAIFILDASGRVTTWNTGARRIKGYLAEEVIGQHFSMFYTAEDVARGRPQALIAAALAEGRVEDEGWRVRKDGARFWADVVITPLRDAEGQLQGFVKVTRDLTSRKQAEAKLRASEESLAATLYSIGDGVIATDEDARITRINPVAERLTGWSERDAVGRPVDEVFRIVNEDTRATVANPVHRVLAEGVIVGLANHTSLIAQDGTERPIADSGAPIRDERGETKGAVLVFRDVSEERSAQEALRQREEEVRLMIASIRDYAIVMLDPAGHIARWSPGAEEIHGYREAEIRGAHFSRLLTREDVASGNPARELATAAARGRFEEESWRVRKDGSRFWASVITTAIRDSTERLVGFVKVTRDLTERRRTDEERLRLAKAQEAIRLRDEFLSIASHELNTPLTALQLQLQRLHEQVGDHDEELSRQLARAVRMGGRLGNLVEVLLDVSRIATGRLRLNLEPFDLSEATTELVERLHDSATNAGCELSLHVAGPIHGRWDRLRIEQVLMNLLSNSFKYAAARPIHVSVRRAGGGVVMQVDDHGPGIPERELPRVFGRFERAASPRHYGGMGLGLYVAQQIVEAHGGTIAAGNLPGAGARVTVRLPLAPPERAPAQDETEPG